MYVVLGAASMLLEVQPNSWAKCVRDAHMYGADGGSCNAACGAVPFLGQLCVLMAHGEVRPGRLAAMLQPVQNCIVPCQSVLPHSTLFCVSFTAAASSWYPSTTV
jgi:hypothetical protein